MFELKHALGFTFNSHMYVLVKGNEFVNTPNEIYKRPKASQCVHIRILSTHIF